jgi:DNA-binding protein H-NS
VEALKKRGVTAESLLIDGTPKAAPAKAVKKTTAKKAAARKGTKTSARKKA